VLTAEFPGRNSGFSLAENTDDLFVGKTLLHGDVLMWLMKTLLTSRCINQRGAGQLYQVTKFCYKKPTIKQKTLINYE
jgi:mannose-6-phosphate isomerase